MKIRFQTMISAGALLGLIWLFHSVPVLWTQENAGVQVTSRVDKSRITIGDLIQYEVLVEHGPEVTVVWPELGSNLGAFEIRDYEVPEPKNEDGRVVERVRYTISTFDTGAFVIPPVVIQYFIPPDSVRRELKTEPIEIYVASLKPSLDGDIRGLKPQEVLPKDWGMVLMYAGIALAAVLLAGAGWWYWRNRKRGTLPFVKSEPPRPPHEVALEQLQQLEAEGLFEKGEIKEHFSRLSEILRAYLEARYYMPALESTTHEIIEHFSRDGQLQGQLEALEKILALCDLVKFARHTPEPEANQEVLKMSYAFIEATKPIFAVEGNGKQESEAAAETKPTEASETEQPASEPVKPPQPEEAEK